MEALINAILDYARVGTKDKEHKVIDCNDVIKRVTTNLQVDIERTDARIVHDELPTLVADDIQLGQLFQNLISNGIKFRSNEPPSILISAERRENEWVFSVRDNGLGIHAKDQERIFEIFQRGGNSSDHHGSGIGLAICKKIVESHEGKIWVQSEPGKGATFYFTLPAKDITAIEK